MFPDPEGPLLPCGVLGPERPFGWVSKSRVLFWGPFYKGAVL